MMQIEYPVPAAEPRLKKLWQLAFGDSEEFIDRFFSTGYSADRCRCIRIGEEIAAALYWLDCEYEGQKMAYIYAVATHPEHQGRGLCRALMEDTHRVLTEQGYGAALLMPAGESLRQMYGKMGYRDATYVSEFTCTPGEPVSVRKIGKEEYAALRRCYLPENGARQEGSSIEYLASYSDFYAGEDFLLAAVPEGHSLIGIELLGSRDAATGILAALGYSEGSFRAPGADRPFAMLRPLKTDVKNPGYFGLVFD
ncbi:MAG: GNAT family N-acetyltransferase [Oscillospiraceae bacterium]|nr:GNAT family N-acetyltransferase [Oscillospiraceae bacterium]